MTTMGDAIYEHLQHSVHLEKTGWAAERVDRVAERLQRDRPRDARLRVHVLWIFNFVAFTAPGRHIFFARQLLELCRNDEMAAMVIAHEIAHHDLGHLDTVPPWLCLPSGREISLLLSAYYRAVLMRLHGPEKECQADRHGLELCLAAGYDGYRCIELFDVLEKDALDCGDREAAYGPDDSDDELAEDAPWRTRMQIWLYQRRRGYLPIRDRRQALRAHLASLGLQS